MELTRNALFCIIGFLFWYQGDLIHAEETPNFESPHVHPLAINPAGDSLVLCNTRENGVEIFAINSEGQLSNRRFLFTGVDPVSVRFRSNTEAWVVNHISDTISIVDLETFQVTATIQTLDEPCDVVFAGSPQRAYVSCSSVNTILVFDPLDPREPVSSVRLEGEDPRALSVSNDGMTVYSAIFESGNGTTILMGGFEGKTPGSAHDGGASSFLPNLVGWTLDGVWTGPYNGQNPPPNRGDSFFPPLNPSNPPAPEVGLIVKDDGSGNWFDDNGGDWTPLVSGDVSPLVSRRSDWELVDNDIAAIDTRTLSVSYQERLMHLCMAIAVNPATDEIAVVGTDATNHIRFEPVLRGKFIRVNVGIVGADGSSAVGDLNPHLDYSVATLPQTERDKSIGDPRGIVWNRRGEKAYITGRGSNNLVVIDQSGNRAGLTSTIEVGEGPTGIDVHPSLDLLYVLNQFDASVSVVDMLEEVEVNRVSFPDSTPANQRNGRRLLFDTHGTSGLGQISCASCHVDTRMDRLAWDLGDPSGEMTPLNRDRDPRSLELNLGGGLPGLTSDFTDFHPMKGPMKTQTLQDIIGHEPFHWRGDRAGIEQFAGAFVSLQGADMVPSDADMQDLKAYLATIHFPPNPFRNTDNSLPTNLPLPGLYGSGAFSNFGDPLPNGNAQRGLDQLYRPLSRGITHQAACVTCHSLPSGVGMDYVADGNLTLQPISAGPNGERHHMLISVDGSVQKTFKASQLRNLYDQVGFDLTQKRSLSGFGIQHDGAIPSLPAYFESLAFTPRDAQEVADLTALMLAFSGSEFGPAVDTNEPPQDWSQDSHAALGRQVTVSDGVSPALLSELFALAATKKIGLVAHSGFRRWTWDEGVFLAHHASETILPRDLVGQSLGMPITFTAVASDQIWFAEPVAKQRPDALVGRSRRSLRFNDVYNVRQRITDRRSSRSTRVTFSAQNDSAGARDLFVITPYSRASRKMGKMTMRILSPPSAGANVTSNLIAGTSTVLSGGQSVHYAAKIRTRRNRSSRRSRLLQRFRVYDGSVSDESQIRKISRRR